MEEKTEKKNLAIVEELIDLLMNNGFEVSDYEVIGLYEYNGPTVVIKVKKSFRGNRDDDSSH